MITYYYTIAHSVSTIYTDKGSKFIAIAEPISSVEAFKRSLKKIKTEHPKANHHCFAYRLGLGNLSFRTADAGEPSGTAGKPILGQIDSKNLTNVAVFVVRYFGGTMLGKPGLINAYKTSTSLALQLVPIIQQELTTSYILQYNYNDDNKIQQLIKQHRVTIITSTNNLFCECIVAVPVGEVVAFTQQLRMLHEVDIALC